jgi:tryptophan synthase alpha subunit
LSREEASHYLLFTSRCTYTRALAARRTLTAATGTTRPYTLARRPQGYYNSFLHYGEARLAADAVAAGVDGFIVGGTYGSALYHKMKKN